MDGEHFQNIHSFTYQKTLLHRVFGCILKEKKIMIKINR